MRTMNIRFFRLALVVIGASACVALDGPAVPLCPANTTVSATLGARPSFSWTPECRIDQIWVTAVLAPSAGPGLQFEWTAATRPPVRGGLAPISYGQAPLGMETTYGPTSLVHGRQYQVMIFGGGAMVGQAYFVP
jgi:hypothetical protein